MSDDKKIIYLAFKNDTLVEDGPSLYACKHCRNKAYSLVWQGEQEFPLLQCTACGLHLGRIGWADNEQS